MAIDLYCFFLSPLSRSVQIMAKHLGIELNQITVSTLNYETREPEFTKINPAHTVPVLVDNGFKLIESRAIMSYLVDKYKPESSLYPKDLQLRATVNSMLYFDGTVLAPSFFNVLIPIFRKKIEPPAEAVETLNEKLSIAAKLLGEKTFFAGEQPTLADISIAALFAMLPLLKIEAPEELHAWYKRACQAIPEIEELNNQAMGMIANLDKKE